VWVRCNTDHGGSRAPPHPTQPHTHSITRRGRAVATRAGKIESVNTYLALCPVVVGIIIATGTEPLFHLYGFIVCVAATAARAFKSVLQVRATSARLRYVKPNLVYPITRMPPFDLSRP
jgi:hypothetical protein